VKTRTHEELEEQFLLERSLAQRLLSAPRAERARVYGDVYDELFRQVPNHPQLNRDPRQRAREVGQKLRLVAPFLSPDTKLMEIGAGDCAFSIKAASLVRQVVAVDVSSVITTRVDSRHNVNVVLSDGISIPVEEGSIDVAYSDQLMEHLHPDDALAQLSNIRRALRPGGTYVCITPNRCTGPHDVSRWFADEASGFHLHEYGISEINALFSAAGFRRLRYYSGGGGFYLPISRRLLEAAESTFLRLPRRMRLTMRNWRLTMALFGVNVAAST